MARKKVEEIEVEEGGDLSKKEIASPTVTMLKTTYVLGKLKKCGEVLTDKADIADAKTKKVAE